MYEATVRCGFPDLGYSFMIIALPLAENETFSSHFGAAAKAGLFEVDLARGALVRAVVAEPPEPEPCGWATWLKELGVEVLLAGGMGRGAQQRMATVGIQVVVGVPDASPVDIVRAWLEGGVVLGANACGGGHHGHHEAHGECDSTGGHDCGCDSH